MGITTVGNKYRVCGPRGLQKYVDTLEEAEAVRKKFSIVRDRKKQKSRLDSLSTTAAWYQTDTGVTCITMFLNKPCERTNRGWTPGLRLQATEEGKPRLNRSRRCYDSDIQIRDVFFELCEVLAEYRGFSSVPNAWLVRNPPTVTRFKVLARQYVAEGYDIPKKFMMKGYK